MRLNKDYLILLCIFLLVLGIRLFFAFRTPTFSDSRSYFNLRQIESIRQTGLPIFYDELSYSGRFYVFLPLFHYVVAVVTIFIPASIAVKLVPNILISLLVFLCYSISNELTHDREASIMSALVAGFLPILFYATVNSLDVLSMVLPLSFAILLSLMKIEKHALYMTLFIFLIVLMAITDQSVIILLLGFLVYQAMIWLVKIKSAAQDIELIYFSVLFVILLTLVLFKNLFFLYGPEIVWQNIPPSILARYFSGFNILEAIYLIGLIPCILGVYAIYKYLFIERDRGLYILISFTFSLSFLIWAGLIEFNTGLLYFSTLLAILFSKAYSFVSDYIRKTKFSKYYTLYIFSFVFLFVLTSLIPSITYANQSINNSVSSQEIRAMKWIKLNTPPDSLVLGSLDEGHIITCIAARKNMMDTNFLLQKNAEQTYDDLTTIYTTKLQTEAVRLLNKYNVDYIIFSDMVKKNYGITQLNYVGDGKCFEVVYDKDVIIYKSLCEIGE